MGSPLAEASSPLQAGLLGTGTTEDVLLMPLTPTPLGGPLLLLLLLRTMFVFSWVFTGDLSHHQPSRPARHFPAAGSTPSQTA